MVIYVITSTFPASPKVSLMPKPCLFVHLRIRSRYPAWYLKKNSCWMSELKITTTLYGEFPLIKCTEFTSLETDTHEYDSQFYWVKGLCSLQSHLIFLCLCLLTLHSLTVLLKIKWDSGGKFLAQCCEHIGQSKFMTILFCLSSQTADPQFHSYTE